MARLYPSLQQIEKQFSFLSPLEEHQRRLVDLQVSVILSPINPSAQVSQEEITTQLRARYGGSAQNWKPQTVRTGLLVKPPDWLYPERLLLDSYIWERDLGLRVFPWDSLDSSDVLPPSRRVLLTIKRFPVEFWHPYYFRQATSSFGVLAGIAPECLSGDKQDNLRIQMDVHDLKQVPYVLYVGHRCRWTECEVEMDGRRPLRNLDHQSPPSSQDYDESSEDEIEDVTPTLDHAPPQIPPLRWQEMNLPIPPWTRQELRPRQPASTGRTLVDWVQRFCRASDSQM